MLFSQKAEAVEFSAFASTGVVWCTYLSCLLLLSGLAFCDWSCDGRVVDRLYTLFVRYHVASTVFPDMSTALPGFYKQWFKQIMIYTKIICWKQTTVIPACCQQNDLPDISLSQRKAIHILLQDLHCYEILHLSGVSTCDLIHYHMLTGIPLISILWRIQARHGQRIIHVHIIWIHHIR